MKYDLKKRNFRGIFENVIIFYGENGRCNIVEDTEKPQNCLTAAKKKKKKIEAFNWN